MRAADLALPSIVLDAVPTIAGWPVRPVIAIAGHRGTVDWDVPAQDVRWDDPGVYWDHQPGETGWLDATCGWTGMEIDTGEPDDAFNFPAARLLLQLDNADGAWSGLDPDGTLSQFGPGTSIKVWAHNAEGDWWLFSGTIARWDQRSDDTVEIEAFDAFSDLAQPIGTYTPGVAADKPSARLSAILTAAGESARPKRFDTGLFSLTRQQTEAAPVEECQIVAGSDGGVFFTDADGALVYFDRTWRDGRADQTVECIASDNVCTAECIVWDAIITGKDEGLADKVVLENVAALQAVAGTSPGFVFTQTDQQWTTQAEGDALAALLLQDRQPRKIGVDEFTLYLLDPNQPDLWRQVDMRRLDRLRFVHDQKAAGNTTVRVDITTLVSGMVHEITPEGWVMTVGTSRAIAFTAAIFYDTGHLYDDGEEYGF